MSAFEYQTTFRVIQTKDKRRGIRLENVYWRTLDALAKQRKTTVARIVDMVATQGHDNLTSALRVFCMEAVVGPEYR